VHKVPGTVVLSCFVVLTEQPHDGNHGGWVPSGTFFDLGGGDNRERCRPNSAGGGVPSPWRVVPFPATPGSVTILHSLTVRAGGIFFFSRSDPNP
jgi:hypothetical protein